MATLKQLGNQQQPYYLAIKWSFGLGLGKPMIQPPPAPLPPLPLPPSAHQEDSGGTVIPGDDGEQLQAFLNLIIKFRNLAKVPRRLVKALEGGHLTVLLSIPGHA